MTLAVYRLSDSAYGIFVATALFSYAVAMFPNYSKVVYEKQEPVSYEEYEDQSGYPVDEDYPVARTVEDMIGCKKNFTIEVESENLIATGYCKAVDEVRPDQRKGRDRIRLLKGACIGQFYMTTLEDGNKVLLYINDAEIDLTKKGTIRLPAGKFELEYAEQGYEESGYEELWKLQDNGEMVIGWYVDMMSGWYHEVGRDKIANLQVDTGIIAWIISLILSTTAYFIIKYRKRRGK